MNAQSLRKLKQECCQGGGAEGRGQCCSGGRVLPPLTILYPPPPRPATGHRKWQEPAGVRLNSLAATPESGAGETSLRFVPILPPPAISAPALRSLGPDPGPAQDARVGEGMTPLRLQPKMLPPCLIKSKEGTHPPARGPGCHSCSQSLIRGQRIKVPSPGATNKPILCSSSHKSCSTNH